MFGSQVLEVMIGLLLIYLALSVASSAIKELIASLLELRSKTLATAIRNMLQDADPSVLQGIFSHPVICATAAPGTTLPSYIASRNFALALIDTLAPADISASPRTIQQLRAAISNLSTPKLRRTLLNLVDSAQGDLEIAQTKIAQWFDDTMERVSGWYKRIAQKLIFGVGLALCLLLNADTLQISKELWSDEALRSAVVSQAQTRIQAGKPPDPSATGASSSGSIASDFQQIGQAVREAHPIPLGWKLRAVETPKTGKEWFLAVVNVLFKLVGILITSFAILAGAPFWFELLNNIINLRISGNPPARSGNGPAPVSNAPAQQPVATLVH